MSIKIAVQPDEVRHSNGEHQSFSQRWTKLAHDQNIDLIPIDVYSRDVISQLSGFDAFMWRCTASAKQRLYAKRLLFAVEKGMQIPTFPSLRTSWYFEDKIAQHYYFSSAGIPTPATAVFWDRHQAEQFCEKATYPFVLKLSSGYEAANVRLVCNRKDALYYVKKLFGSGVVSLSYRPAPRSRLLLRRLRAAAEVAKGRNPYSPTVDAEMQHGYFYAQEFIPDNEFNTRVTIIGNRAFLFRMFNRPDDFRASLSGAIDWDPEKVGEDVIRLAFRAAYQLKAQTVAFDIIRRGAQPVIIELTFNYASWAVRDCPGHWVLKGDPDSGRLEWVNGSLEPADAIFEDFVAQDCVQKAARIHTWL